MRAGPVTIVAHDVGGIGGMERQLEVLITGLLNAGAQVTIISRTCELPPHERMRWLRVPGPTRPFVLAFPWFFLAASAVLLFRGSGLVHSTGSLIATRVDLTTVHFCHLGARRTGRIIRRRRSNLVYTLNALLAPLISELTERWCYRPGKTGRLVAVSDGVVRELRSCYPKLQDEVEMIPNGVDLEEYQPDQARCDATRSALGIHEKALVAVFVGGDWERKGLVHAIEAIGRRPRWHLIVLGSGDALDYEARAAAHGCADRVHFVGEVSDVSRYLAAGDAFVLPTHYEAAPLVTYEAAAAGLPLLVTPVNGVEDLLRDGVNGWFIEAEADSIEPRLAALERNVGLRTRMGRAARDAVRRFDWDSVVSEYIRLYARLTPDRAVARAGKV
jgi:glycosyltransferase involved in cell wall biosynthesis